MYVECINGSVFLRKGEKYKVIARDNSSYFLENMGWFHKMNFLSIEDYRTKRINEIFSYESDNKDFIANAQEN
jgi:hypothetical protein